MADWTFKPVYAYDVEVNPPETLRTRYEDRREDRREKHPTFVRVFAEHHVRTGAEVAAMDAFFRSKGLLVAFTKVTYDPADAPGAEVTVTFRSSFKWSRVGPDEFTTDIEFVEDIT